MNFIFKRYRLITIVTTILAIIGTLLSARLKIKSSFSDLLPEKERVVKDLKKIDHLLGGIGFLIVTIEGKDERLIKDTMIRLAKSFRKEKDLVRFVRYRSGRDFVERYGGYYLSLQELNKIYDLLIRWKEKEIAKRVPGYFDLEEERSQDPEKELLKILRNKKTGSLMEDDLLYDKKTKMGIVLIKPVRSSVDLNFSKRLLDTSKRIIQSVKRNGLRITLTGRYVTGREEIGLIKKDLAKTSIVAITLISILLMIFFNRPGRVLIMSMALLFGIAINFGIVYLTLNYLNVITVILVAILMGLGIDHGIHFLYRYQQLRNQGLSLNSALSDTLHRTGKSIFTSALTTAIAFYSITFTEFKGISQFGFIAGTGMIITMCAMLIFLPAFLIFLEKDLKIPFNLNLKEPTIPEGRFPMTAIIITLSFLVTVYASTLLPDISGRRVDAYTVTRKDRVMIIAVIGNLPSGIVGSFRFRLKGILRSFSRKIRKAGRKISIAHMVIIIPVPAINPNCDIPLNSVKVIE